ncbi:protein of unknown function [Acidithiobacillus ferrivorans]|uniref:Uncharacterized protein n=1 Tax=Acidithiobacillus ferrivorans TaxID=160808 RepID=A0A060UL27_9PROT|nr:hypothetical protein AFERRI_240024 [Acidithiobacillus ferrivorans]SMH64859.1 protein of unknown function [Acidithiobacillus ferrivorans]
MLTPVKRLKRVVLILCPEILAATFEYDVIIIVQQAEFAYQKMFVFWITVVYLALTVDLNVVHFVFHVLSPV